MRKLTYVLVAFVTLSMAGCIRTDESIDANGGLSITSVEALIADEPDTRTSAGQNEDGSIQMLWSSDDEIAVSDLTNVATFKLKDGAGTTHGRFAGSIVSTSKQMYAVYPASAAEISGSEAKVTIPNIQAYTSSSDANVGARNLMVGETSDASLFDFYTVAAIARFDITVGADETICSVKMSVEDGYLSGSGTIDLQGRTLGQLDKRNVTLNYTEPDKGHSAGGWVLVAPVDFTSIAGDVLYEVVTSKGTYTFCRKPTKAFQAGMVYNFPLSVNDFEQVSSTSELEDGKYCFASNASSLTLHLVRATDTTLSVAWSNEGFPEDCTADAADTYEITLSDERNQLLVAWRPNTDQCVTENDVYLYSSTNPIYSPRFIFTGLEPATNYRVSVKNVTRSKSSGTVTMSTAPVDCGEVVSTARNAGDIILFENFGKLVFNGDITTRAAGYVSSSYSSFDNIDDCTAWGDYRSETQTEYKYTRSSREQQVFDTYKTLVTSFGLADWAHWKNPSDETSTTCRVLSRPGYLKIGTAAVRGGIVTPELSALVGTAKVKVSFKACIYNEGGPSDDVKIGVRAVDGATVSNYILSGYTEVDNKTLSLSDQVEWNTYSVELSNVTPTSRIVVYGNGSTKNKNRFCIDDIRVELVEYGEGVSTDVPVAKQVAASPYSATVEWSEVEQDTRKYTLAIYKDYACTDKYQEYTTSISKSTTYINWPARFTFTYLEPETTYYVTVTDLAGNTSGPAAVRTSAEPESVKNEVLAEYFDKLCWGGDYINMANSVTLSGVSAGSYAPEQLSDAIQYTVAGSSATTDGSRLTTYSDKINQLFGLEEWESEAAHVRPGYVKLGTASTGGWLMTPYLSNLSSDNAQITVSFKACPFVDSSTEQTPYINVELVGFDGTVKDSRTVTIGGVRSQPGWETYTLDMTSVGPTDRLRFSSGGDASSRFCLDEIVVTSPSAVAGDLACGYIRDDAGSPISGVVVSDGFTVTTTNASGYYMLKPCSDTWYIYYSIPSEYEVPINSYGQPCFYQRYTPGIKRYDFNLTRLASGPEKEFVLFCLADPQCRGTDHANRFKNECVPDVKAHSQTKTVPCYGVTLGDIVYSEGSSNSQWNMSPMRDAMAADKIGMPVFQVMGNHDYTYFSSSSPIATDETSSTIHLKTQRAFENVFGPIDYSWNRGDVHIVCMRNIMFSSKTSASSYDLGFTDSQYEWLKADLSHVSKDKMVILCVHIPLLNSSNSNVQNVLSLLKQFSESHIMSGHTHYMRNEPTRSGMYEHVHAAVSGAWWYSKINGDGSPNGYGVYTIDGAKIRNWYYKGFNEGMNDRNYQIRLYRGDHRSGGKYEYFKQQHGSNVLLANVFNTDSSWKVYVYENDVYSGTMTLIPNKKYTSSSVPYSSTNSMTNPTLIPTASSQDWWAIGLHIGVVGRGHAGGNRNNYMTNSFHIYKYTLKNPNASIRVEAYDRFGTKYTATEITEDYDYTNASY